MSEGEARRALPRRRVLVTRPQPGLKATCAQLEAVGFTALALPLTRIVALRDVPPVTEVFDAVVATSANALRHAPECLIEGLQGRRFYAVGEKTAAALAEAGLVPAGTAGDASGLAALIAAKEAAGARVLYLCGRVRRACFEEDARRLDLVVKPVETYDTQAIEHTRDSIVDRIGWNPIWGALVYSLAGATRAGMLVFSPGLQAVFERTHFFCLSGRIARQLGEAAGEIPEHRLHVAPSPDEEALLALMRQMQ